MWKTVLQRRHLIWAMTRAEFQERYARQTIGTAWAWLTPLIMMALYTAVFNFIYKSRFASDAGLPRDYVTYACSGLTVWLMLQDVIARAPDAIVTNASYIRQMAFPIEVLPIKRAIASLPIAVTGFVFVVLYQLLRFGSVPWTVMLWPILVLCLVTLSIGLTFILGSLGVFFRDLREVVSVLLAANLFLLPILFPPASAPAGLEVVFRLNPLSYFIWLQQDMLFYGKAEHRAAWVIVPLLSVGALMTGRYLFERLRPGFGDAI
jgi:lipopolysaccharide transport system permease protein